MTFFGLSVSSAGDVNGDSKGDILIGSTPSDPAKSMATVIYGTADKSLTGTTVYADALTTSTGVIFSGFPDPISFYMSGARDVNGDHVADVIIGLPYLVSWRKGLTCVIFGRKGGFLKVSMDVVTLGSSDFQELYVHGATGDESGYSVSGRNVNGDRYDDVIIGSKSLVYGGTYRCYVVFGGASLNGQIINLTKANANVLTIQGATHTLYGISVSSGGDANGDGIDDILIGSPWMDSPYLGAVYLIYGQSGSALYGSMIDLTNSWSDSIEILSGNGSSRSQ